MTIDQMLNEAADDLHAYREAISLPDLDSRIAQRSRVRSRRGPIVAVAAAVVVVFAFVWAVFRQPTEQAPPVVEQPTVTTADLPNTVEPTTPPLESTTPAPTTTSVQTPDVPTITWSRIELPVTGSEAGLDTIADTEFGLLAGGLDGSAAAIWISSDGSAWERAAILSSDGDVVDSEEGRIAEVLGFASKAGRAVAIGFEGTGEPGPVYFWGLDRWESRGAWLDANPVAAVWYSEDGATWTRVAHDESVFGGEEVVRMWAVAASDNEFVAVGDSVWRSEDGLTWERSPSPGGKLFAVIYDGTQFIAGGMGSGGGQGIYRSADGVEWTELPIEQALVDWDPSPLLDITKTDWAYVAVGGGVESRIWRAADIGLDMEVVYKPTRSRFHYLSGVAADGDRVVAVGEHFGQGTLALLVTSVDGGLTWTTEKTDAAFGSKYNESSMSAVRDLVMADGRIIAVGRIGFGAPVVWIGEWTD